MRHKILATVLLFNCGFTFSSAVGQEEERAAAIEVAIETLVEASSDKNELIRERAFLALKRIKTSSQMVMERVQTGLNSEDPGIRRWSMQVLNAQAWDDEVKGRMLFHMLSQSRPDVVREAAENFQEGFQKHEIDKILNLIRADDTPAELKQVYLQVVARNHADFSKTLPVLEELYEKSEQPQQLQILAIISNFRKTAEPALHFLAEQVKSEDQQIRLMAIDSIQEIMAPGRTPSRSQSRSLAARQTAYVDGIFRRYDTDKNGVLDAEETSRSAGASKMDVDGDGRVTRDEAMQSLVRTRDR